ncbi:MAG: antibiotic biosynthesis monooxygenase [Deltaproteobacteria bacterium]|nr:antibiotic biosynthesis monooxygenase [Deltaproteobacteria bacterium]
MRNVSVMVEVHPEFAEKYLEAVLRHADNSLSKEEGCVGFAVHRHEKDPNRFFLYESYRSRKDFEEVHSVAPYLAEFNKLTASWVKAKDIQVWDHVPAKQ